MVVNCDTLRLDWNWKMLLKVKDEGVGMGVGGDAVLVVTGALVLVVVSGTAVELVLVPPVASGATVKVGGEAVFATEPTLIPVSQKPAAAGQ